MSKINDNNFYQNIFKLLEFKTLVLKMSIPGITLNDVTSYFFYLQLKNISANDLNLVRMADFILSISENKIIEYLNIKETTKTNLNINDFKNLF